MTASNLAIVFGPTLLNSPDEEAIVKDMNASHKLIETLVLTHQELFDQPSPQVGGAGRSVRRGGAGRKGVNGRRELLGIAAQWNSLWWW